MMCTSDGERSATTREQPKVHNEYLNSSIPMELNETVVRCSPHNLERLEAMERVEDSMKEVYKCLKLDLS